MVWQKGGNKQSKEEGKEEMCKLIVKLYGVGRLAEIERAAMDKEVRKKLMEEFKIC